jgi:hypothetical protein
MSILANVETKVIAASAGGGGGAAVSAFVLWLLGVTVWGQSADAGKASAALAAVPSPVSAIVAVVLSLAGAGLAGYLAPHTSRADLGDLTPVVVDATPAPAASVFTPPASDPLTAAVAATS